MSEQTKTGWWNPDPMSGRKRSTFHYIGEDRRSLCGKWAYLGYGEIEEGNDNHHENCASCKKKKAAINKRAEKVNRL